MLAWKHAFINLNDLLSILSQEHFLSYKNIFKKIGEIYHVCSSSSLL